MLISEHIKTGTFYGHILTVIVQLTLEAHNNISMETVGISQGIERG